MALVRRMTAATAGITLACLFVEMLCYVLGRLHSSCVLSTKIRLHRLELTGSSRLMRISLLRISLLRFFKTFPKNLPYANFGLFISLVRFFWVDIFS